MKHSFSESLRALPEAKQALQNLQGQWQAAVDDMREARAELRNGDLFARLNYLAFCDQFCMHRYIDLKTIHSECENLNQLKVNLYQDQEKMQRIHFLLHAFQELSDHQTQQTHQLQEEYAILAEEILSQTQDLITRFSNALPREQTIPDLEDQVNQNLEKKLFLQELKDSLEFYREARENFISESEWSHHQYLPNEHIPEDLGEEKPQIDPILSQLDTAITACDAALLIQDTEE